MIVYNKGSQFLLTAVLFCVNSFINCYIRVVKLNNLMVEKGKTYEKLTTQAKLKLLNDTNSYL